MNAQETEWPGRGQCSNTKAEDAKDRHRGRLLFVFYVYRNRMKHSLLPQAEHVVVSSGKAMQLARKICQDSENCPPHSAV